MNHIFLQQHRVNIRIDPLERCSRRLVNNRCYMNKLRIWYKMIGWSDINEFFLFVSNIMAKLHYTYKSTPLLNNSNSLVNIYHIDDLLRQVCIDILQYDRHIVYYLMQHHNHIASNLVPIQSHNDHLYSDHILNQQHLDDIHRFQQIYHSYMYQACHKCNL